MGKQFLIGISIIIINSHYIWHHTGQFPYVFPIKSHKALGKGVSPRFTNEGTETQKCKAAHLRVSEPRPKCRPSQCYGPCSTHPLISLGLRRPDTA